MTGPARFDAVICDVDGVVRHWPPPDAIEQAAGLAVGTLSALAFAEHRVLPAITGLITDEQWRTDIAADLAARVAPGQDAAMIVDAWASIVPRTDHDVVALLTGVREVMTVALLSNATTRLEADLERAGLTGVAHTIVNTARIGVAKPDHRAFRIAARMAGAEPARCLFVDDTEVNVIAAREVGMTAVHFRTVDDLRAVL